MYLSPVTRENPTAFILLVDQSGSMNERIFFAGVEMPKSRAVTLVASAFIDELIHRARREEGVRDYYDLAVLGYGGGQAVPATNDVCRIVRPQSAENETQVSALRVGRLRADELRGNSKIGAEVDAQGRGSGLLPLKRPDRGGENHAGVHAQIHSLISPAGTFTTPSRLAAQSVRREKISRERLLPNGRSVIAVTEQNIWIAERAEGSTPMCAALREALGLVQKWCRRPKNAGNYPPTIINITDGEASDGTSDEIRQLAGQIRATGTNDGPTILINIHLARAGCETVRSTQPAATPGGGLKSPPAGSRLHANSDCPQPQQKSSVIFPTAPEQLPDHRYAQLLWEISSDLPEGYGFPGARALAFNADIAELAAMMNIGSINSVML